MSVMRLPIFAALMVYSTACVQAQGRPVNDYAPDGSALRALSGVRLGMTYREVRQARRGAVPAPYIGLAERIGDDSVHYLFAQGRPTTLESAVSLEAIAPEEFSPLLAVEVLTYFNSTPSADSAWARAARELTVRAGHSCYILHRAMMDQRALITIADSVYVGAVSSPAQVYKGVGGNAAYPAMLSIFITDVISHVVSDRVKRSPIDCDLIRE